MYSIQYDDTISKDEEIYTDHAANLLHCTEQERHWAFTATTYHTLLWSLEASLRQRRLRIQAWVVVMVVVVSLQLNRTSLHHTQVSVDMLLNLFKLLIFLPFTVFMDLVNCQPNIKLFILLQL